MTTLDNSFCRQTQREMTTLENSYCVPRTKEEWSELGADKSWDFREGSVVYTSNPVSAKIDFVKHFSNEVLAGPIMRNRNEIPVPRFLDLMHDKIVPWRLEEVGFFRYELSHLSFDEMGLIYYDNEGLIYHLGIPEPLNITTFTDLLTLIRMLTPPLT